MRYFREEIDQIRKLLSHSPRNLGGHHCFPDWTSIVLNEGHKSSVMVPMRRGVNNSVASFPGHSPKIIAIWTVCYASFLFGQ